MTHAHAQHSARTHATFQTRAVAWVREAFGSEPADDRAERAHHFLEEALETVQAAGTSHQEALELVTYVYERPAGDVAQEVGGVLLTLAPFAAAHGVDMQAAGETELARVSRTDEHLAGGGHRSVRSRKKMPQQPRPAPVRRLDERL
ncbi:hypothetical protein ACFFLM_05665 [Deinococcus oregonensis]|uniref:Uncharacterized protein n=1 Tax=Deinococcus oregonensis TaxID=1805970 RepID=A0ABV6AVD4_9DEIO